MNDPYKNYKANSISTMTKGEQLILLFDKAIQRLNVSKTLLDDDNKHEAIIQLNRTRDIFNYLIVALDRSYEHADELISLYTFINSEIVKAAGKCDKSYIDEVLPIVIDLRDTWEEASKLARINK